MYYLICSTWYIDLPRDPPDGVDHLVGKPGDPGLVRVLLLLVTPGEDQNIPIGVNRDSSHYPAIRNY